MALHVGIFIRGVIKHGDIGQDKRIRSELRGHIYRALPTLIAVRVRKRIDGDMQFTAVTVNVIRGFLQFFFREIQTGEMACIGIIFQADIHRVGAIIDRRFQCR